MKTTLSNIQFVLGQFKKLMSIRIDESRLEEIKQDHRNLEARRCFLGDLK